MPRPHAEGAAALAAAPTAASIAAPAGGAAAEAEGPYFKGVDSVVLQTDDPYFGIHHATAFEEDGGRTGRLYTAGWPSVVPGPFLGDWGGAIPS